MPGPGRVSTYNGQIWKISGQCIQIDWACIIKFDPHTTRSSCPQTICTCMEERGHSQCLYFLHQGIKLWIVGIKRLNARVKFCTSQPQIFNGTLHLLDSGLSLMWIDARKANKLLWITLDDSGDVIVVQWWQTGCCLCIPREKDANHIQFSIISSDLLNIFQLDLRTKIALSRLCIRAKRHLHKLRCWQMDMKVDSTRHTILLPKNIATSTTNSQKASLNAHDL